MTWSRSRRFEASTSGRRGGGGGVADVGVWGGVGGGGEAEVDAVGSDNFL